MFKPKQKSVMLAILVGVLGFIGAYLSGHAGIPKQSDILVAARDIQPGQAIDGDSLTMVSVPGKVPPTLLTKDDLKKILGKTVDYEIPAGVPLSQNYVSDQAQRDGLDQDQVGVWLPVSLENGGDVMPGDRVDIFAATNNAMTAGGRPILSYVRVVRAVNSSGTDLNRAKQVSTIGATPVSSPGVPAAVELAVTTPQAAQMASIMQSSHVLLALSPWAPQDDGTTQLPVLPGQPTGQGSQTEQPAQGSHPQPGNSAGH